MIYDTRLGYKGTVGVGGVCAVLTGAEGASSIGRTQTSTLRWILSTAAGCWWYSICRTTTWNTTTSLTSCQPWETLVIFSPFISPCGSISVTTWAPRWYGSLSLETGSILFLNGKRTLSLLILCVLINFNLLFVFLGFYLGSDHTGGFKKQISTTIVHSHTWSSFTLHVKQGQVSNHAR